MTESNFRCMDLIKAPGGWLQCVRPMGHPDSKLHWVDVSENIITQEQLVLAQSYLNPFNDNNFT